MTRPRLAAPQTTQAPGPDCSYPVGRHRIVTDSASFTFVSHAADPHQWAEANPPWISGFSRLAGVWTPRRWGLND